MRVQSLLCGCALLWVGASVLPGRAHAYCRSTTETPPTGECREDQGLPLFWDRECLDVHLHQSVPIRLTGISDARMRSVVEASFGAWESVDCGSAPFDLSLMPDAVAGDPVAFAFDFQNQAMLSALTAAEWAEIEQPPTAFAITFVFHDPKTGRIYDVDIALNLGAGPFVECESDCRDGRVDLQNTLTHEVGHMLGLGHSSVERSTMQIDAIPGQTFMRTLEADDRAGLCALSLPGAACSTGACACPPPPVIPSVVRQQVSSCTVVAGHSPSVPATWLWLGGPAVWFAMRRRRRSA